MGFFFSPVEMGRMLLVRPDVTAAVARVGQRFEAETGEKLYVIRGWVTMAQQAAVYADSLASGYRASPASKSRHPLGAAVDLGIVGHVHDDAAIDQADPLYAILARIVLEEGLVSGYNFKTGLPDPYHVEANEPLEVSQATWAALMRGRLWRAAIAVAVIVAVVAAFIIVNRSRRANAR